MLDYPKRFLFFLYVIEEQTNKALKQARSNSEYPEGRMVTFELPEEPHSLQSQLKYSDPRFSDHLPLVPACCNKTTDSSIVASLLGPRV